MKLGVNMAPAKFATVDLLVRRGKIGSIVDLST